MVPAGIMLDKFGPRIVLTISGILMGLGMIIAGIFLNLIGLIIGFGIIAGAAMGFGYAAPTPTATRWFKPHMRGNNTGVGVLSYCLIPCLFMPISKWVIRIFGISNVFI